MNVDNMGHLGDAGETDALPCADKLVFDTQKQAAATANVTHFRYGSKMYAYRCRYCDLWHLSSGSPK